LFLLRSENSLKIELLLSLTFSTENGKILNTCKAKNNFMPGRSSVWLERYLGVVEAARSSRVAPTSIDFYKTSNPFDIKELLVLLFSGAGQMVP